MLKKLLLWLALVGLTLPLGLCGYSVFFSKSSRVYSHIGQVKIGMSQQEVTRILTAPDTTYQLEFYKGSAFIMHYDMGFGAPDALRIFIEHDTVTAVVYNQ